MKNEIGEETGDPDSANQGLSPEVNPTVHMPPEHHHRLPPEGGTIEQISVPIIESLRSHVLGDRYQLGEEIARGGMGVIIKGHDNELGRDLAVKVLLDKQKDNPEVVQRFVEEAQIGGQLQHPGIVPVYELGRFSDDRPFFAMKLVKGKTLGNILRSRDSPQSDRSQLIGIFEQVCQTLAYAHSRNVIHRDLKPDNIMVGAFGEVQVMDWGLAKVLMEDSTRDKKKPDESSSVNRSIIQTVRSGDSSQPGGTSSETHMGSVLGTPAYMSPEQALGDIGVLDERADVFGLGAILCEILTGRPPYTGGSGTVNLRSAIRGNLTDAFVRLDESGADPELMDLAKSCLAPEYTDRPRNAEIVSEAVTGYLHSVEQKLREAEQARVAEATKAVERRKRRTVWMALAGCVVLLLGSFSVGTILIQQKDARLAAEKAGRLEKQIADAETIRRKNVEITAANESLVKARTDAVHQQQRAESSLSDMQTTYGLIASKNNQTGQSALWFSRASASATSDERRQTVNQIRCRNWLAATALPVRTYQLEFEGGLLRRFEFHPLGDLLLIHRFGKLHVWNWVSDEEIEIPWGNISSAAWNPNGTSLITADDAGTIRSYSVDDWQPKVVAQLPEPVQVMTFSPDGRHLAIGADKVHIWDIRKQKMLKVDWQQPAKPYAINFAGDSQRFAVSDFDSMARVFSLATMNTDEAGKPLLGPLEQRPTFDSPAWIGLSDWFITTNNQQMASRLGFGKDEQSHLLNSTMGNLTSVSRSGDLFLFAGKTNGYLYRKNGTFYNAYAIDHNDSEVTDVAFTADEQMALTVAWDQTARLWNTQDGTPLCSPIPHTGIVEKCAIFGNGSFIATADQDGLVRIFRVAAPNVPAAAIDDFGQNTKVSREGRYVSPGIWHQDPWGNPGSFTLRPYDVQNSRQVAEIRMDGMLIDSCICEESELVAAIYVLNSDSHLAAWNLATGEPVLSDFELNGQPRSIVARPGSTEVAVLAEPGRVICIEPVSGDIRFDVSLQDWGESDRNWPRLEYTPRGDRLIVSTGGKINRIEVLSADDGTSQFSAIQPVLEGGPCRDFAISGSGGYLVTAVNGKNAAQVWNIQTGKPLCEPLLHPGDVFGIYCVKFSPDEKLIFTGGKDRQVRIWNWSDGKISGPTLELADEVFCLEPHPDGNHLLTGGRDGKVILWDLESGKPLCPAFDFRNSITSLRIVPGTNQLLVTSSDRIASPTPNRLYVVDLGSWLEPSTQDEGEQLRMSELVSGHTIERNSTRLIDRDGWLERLETQRAQLPNFGLPTPQDRLRAQHRLTVQQLDAANWSLAAAYSTRALDTARQISENDIQLLIELALNRFVACTAAGDEESAIAALAALRAALADEPESAELLAWKQKVELLGKLSSPELTPDQWLQLVRCIESPKALLTTLSQLQNEERWLDVIAVNRAARTVFPNHDSREFGIASFRVGYANRRLDRTQESIDAYLQAIELGYSVAATHSNLAYCFKSVHRWKEAIKHFRETARLLPRDAPRWTVLGEALLETGHFEEAVESYQKAFELDATIAKRLVDRSTLLRNEKRYDDAAACVLVATKLEPNRDSLHYLLAELLKSTGRYRAAHVHADMTVRLKPDDAKYQSLLAVTHLDNANYAEAEIAAREAVKLAPDYLAGHINLGRALLQLDRVSEAIDVLQKSKELTRENSAIPSVFLAKAYRKERRFEESLTEGRAAVKELEKSSHLANAWWEVAVTLLESDTPPDGDEEKLKLQLAMIVLRDQPAPDAETMIEAAERCHREHRYGQAFRLFQEAFAASPEFSDSRNRFNAICSATQAYVQDNEQEMLIKVISLLIEELQSESTQYKSADPSEIEESRNRLKRWLADEDLEVLRNFDSEFGAEHAVRLTAIWASVKKLVRDE